MNDEEITFYDILIEMEMENIKILNGSMNLADKSAQEFYIRAIIDIKRRYREFMKSKKDDKNG